MLSKQSETSPKKFPRFMTLRFDGVISRTYARPMTRGTMLLSVNSHFDSDATPDIR
jgi:hypothetical protein